MSLYSRNSQGYNTDEWKSYFQAVELTGKFMDYTFQYFLDVGWIDFSGFFKAVDQNKAAMQLLNKKLLPNHLADNRFLNGTVDVEYLVAIDCWAYFASKYLFIYQAIRHYGIREEDLSWIFDNLVLDFKEEPEKDFKLFKATSHLS